MDTQVSSTQDIFVEIVHDVYPMIEKHFDDLQKVSDWKQHNQLKESVLELEREFNSLSYYERKLVFPCLMDKINNEQKLPINQNPEEIGRLISQKEHRIYLLCRQIENLAESAEMSEKHAIFELINIFNGTFRDVKDKWQLFLKKLSTQRACPVHMTKAD